MIYIGYILFFQGFRGVLDKPAEATRGPRALASAPRALNTPITAPFWLSEPYAEIIVVTLGTTVAEATKCCIIQQLQVLR